MNYVAQILTLTMNDTTFRFTDVSQTLEYAGNEYIAGIWKGLDKYEERVSPAINEHDIELNDTDLALTLNAYSGKWQWQELTVQWLIYDENLVLDEVIQVLKGGVTEPDSDESDDDVILRLRVQENHTLELVHGTKTNTASQSLIDATDEGFELIPFLDGIKLPWGKPGEGRVLVPETKTTTTRRRTRAPGVEIP